MASCASSVVTRNSLHAFDNRLLTDTSTLLGMTNPNTVRSRKTERLGEVVHRIAARLRTDNIDCGICPPLSPPDGGKSGRVDAEEGSQDGASSGVREDKLNLSGGQFRSAMPLADRRNVSAFFAGIPIVFGVPPQEQVGLVHAQFDIATMAHQKSDRNFAVVVLP